MIFAEMDYPEKYGDFHYQLKDYLLTHFKSVECGLQSDSWFWIHDGDLRVQVDTFSSMKHQVKAAASEPHVQAVIAALQRAFKVNVYAEPVPEGHEDG